MRTINDLSNIDRQIINAIWIQEVKEDLECVRSRGDEATEDLLTDELIRLQSEQEKINDRLWQESLGVC